MKNQIKKLEKQITQLKKEFVIFKQKCYTFHIQSNFKKELTMEKQDKINVFDVAQFFVNKDKNINKTKIQKLLYYAQGYYLAKYNKVLFQDAIEAWPYGPVIPSVYAETLKQEFKKKEIQSSFDYFDFSSQMTHFPFTEEQKEILEQVFHDFGKMSAVQLSEKTHNEVPWKDTYDPNKLYSQCVIKPSVLYNFFKNKKN